MVLLLPLSLAIDNSEFNNCSGGGLVATFNGGSVGGQQGSGEIQTQQSNQGDVGDVGQHWVLAFNGDIF